jgi:exopolyphosphatase/guanosine-5'-triphosphate,3'-diphosphate pyrophosphatase
MPLASVDVGSNSVRMLIGEVSEGRVLPGRYEREVTRLASGIAETGLAGEHAIGKTIHVLKTYSENIRAAGVKHVKSIGTSAVREAENSEELLVRIRNETGLDVEIISGQEEAGLTALGVLSSMDLGASTLVVDIGGGSTEAVIVSKGEIVEVVTLPVGAVKLLEKHIRLDPPSRAELLRLDAEAEVAAEELEGKIKGKLKGDTEFVATAGTATTLAAIDLGLRRYDRERIHGHDIPIGRLHEISRMLSAMTIEERKKVRGLEPGRADLIITGAKLTIKFMERLEFRSVQISDYGLLEGALLKLSQEVSR